MGSVVFDDKRNTATGLFLFPLGCLFLFGSVCGLFFRFFVAALGFGHCAAPGPKWACTAAVGAGYYENYEVGPALTAGLNAQPL